MNCAYCLQRPAGDDPAFGRACTPCDDYLFRVNAYGGFEYARHLTRLARANRTRRGEYLA